jgi:thiol-disulfide isomerase/thioredoxin
MPALPTGGSRRRACLHLAAAALAPAASAFAAAASASASVAASAAASTPANATSTSTATGDAARWLPWPARRATPPLRLPDLEDQPWELAQEQGHPVLLNFWATWCEPCRAEMQSFEVLQAQFAARRLTVVTVNFKEGREPVQRFRESQALSLAFVRDAYGEAARAWGVRSFPTTFVINPAGHAVLRIEGGLDWGSPAVQHRLQALL